MRMQIEAYGTCADVASNWLAAQLRSKGLVATLDTVVDESRTAWYASMALEMPSPEDIGKLTELLAPWLDQRWTDRQVGKQQKAPKSVRISVADGRVVEVGGFRLSRDLRELLTPLAEPRQARDSSETLKCGPADLVHWIDHAVDEPVIGAAKQAVFAARQYDDGPAEVLALVTLERALREAGRNDEARCCASCVERLVGEARSAASYASRSRQTQVLALVALGRTLCNGGWGGEAESVFGQARRIVDDLVDTAVEAASSATRPPNKLAHARKLLRFGWDLEAAGSLELSSLAFDRGRQIATDVADSARRTAEQAVSAARERGDQMAEAQAPFTLQYVLREAWAADDARAVLEEAEQLAFNIVDAATRVAFNARERGSQTAQVLALLTLGQALHYLQRPQEARSVIDYASQIAHDTDNHELQTQVTTARRKIEKASEARRDWQQALAMSDERETGVAYSLEPVTIEVAIGFVALKLLGPFLEAFATKLGEQLGEATGRVIRRIQLHVPRSRTDRTRELRIDSGADQTTTLVLPEDLSDEAKLALIDLDVTAQGVRGATLFWDSAAGKWRSEPRP